MIRRERTWRRRPRSETFSRPVILLLGGRDKGGDFDSLAVFIRKGVKKVVLFGEAREASGGLSRHREDKPGTDPGEGC